MSKIFFLLNFLPVNFILLMLVTITKSPLSMCGLKVDLFFPLSTFEIKEANLPTARFSASDYVPIFFYFFF